MEIIDNINRMLGDSLKETIVPGARLKILTGDITSLALESWNVKFSVFLLHLFGRFARNELNYEVANSYGKLMEVVR